jgi:Fe-S-cluster containining protein
MTLTPLFRRYEALTTEADQAFSKMAREFRTSVKCRSKCSDCCHAVFGVFLIEAAYLRFHFGALERKIRRGALLRGEKAERELERLEERLKRDCGEDPDKVSFFMARERVRCPLLNDQQECVLYAHRPLTCRVYGIPTSIRGRAHVCGQSGFGGGQSYPLFALDAAYRELYLLSTELIQVAGIGDLERASLLIGVPAVIRNPLEGFTGKNALGSRGVP